MEGYEHTIRNLCDSRAGAWIFDAARTDKAFIDFPEPSVATKTLVHQLSWTDFAEREETVGKIAQSDSALTTKQRETLRHHLEARVITYGRIRQDGTLWTRCEGKEIFRQLAPRIGFSDYMVAERAIIGLWQANADLQPQALTNLRAYVSSIKAASEHANAAQ